MRRRGFIFLMLLCGLLLAACETQGAVRGMLVLSGEHRIQSGESVQGDLALLSGQVALDEGARVEGSVYMVGGTLDLRGEVDGDLSQIGGQLNIENSAQIEGNVNLGGGQVERSPQARIGGAVQSGVQIPAGLEQAVTAPRQRPVWTAPEAVLLAILAFLAVRFLPRPVERVGQAILQHSLVSLAMGILVLLVGPVLLVMMAFTLILIPITVIGLGAAVVMFVYGIIGFGAALGDRLVRALGWELRPAFAAVLGTLLYVLVVDLLALIPTVGGLLSLLTALIGLGAVVLTRLGLRRFVPASEGESLL
jgi:hypothetical protein